MNESVMYHLYKFAQDKRFESVLNIGSTDRHKGKFVDPKNFFKTKKYVGVDKVEGEYTDIVMDAKKLEFPIEVFDCIICTETLEHIDNIFRAAHEIEKVLAKNGFLFISVPFHHAFHDYPGDYWRMTPTALDFLFKKLKRKELYLIGGI